MVTNETLAVKRRRPWARTPLIPPPLTLDMLIAHALAGCLQCRDEVSSLAKDAAQMAIDEGPIQ